MHHPTQAEAARVWPGPDPGRPRGLRARYRVKLLLHQAIVSGTIPGGTRLVQSSIAQQLAVGTQPVRDAIHELASEGLIRMDARGGAVVHELCRSELEDIYQIRMLLEPLATAHAAGHASQESVMRAVALLAAMESETDAARWADQNARFHSVINEAGSSPRLVAILRSLREQSARYITHSIRTTPERTRQANAEHEEIMRAVVARDPKAAAEAMFRHLDGTLAALSVHQLGADPRGTRPAGRSPRPRGQRGASCLRGL
jgi:DNA-binding GntR family transcriptional regulator